MKGKTSLMTALFSGLFFASIAGAETLGDGIAAWALQDFTRARAIFEDLASKGDAEAAYRLGILHESGLGHEIDRAEALRWHRLAAERGHDDARRHAADLELSVADRSRLSELVAAAGNGSFEAMMTLARAHASGEGAPLDRAAARDWLVRLRDASSDVDERVHAWALAALERF